MKKIKWLGKEVYLFSKEEMEEISNFIVDNVMGEHLTKEEIKERKLTRLVQMSMKFRKSNGTVKKIKYEWGKETTTTYVFDGTVFTHSVTPLVAHYIMTK